MSPTPQVIIAALLALMMLASFAASRSKLPYTLILVSIGIVLTALGANTVSVYIGGTYINSILVNSNLLVGLVVPPLIFEAMMHVRSSDLKAMIVPSFSLATLGVVVATVVGGTVLWQMVGLPFNVSFLFAALISPTDAATVLEVFKRAKVPPKLAALMDTEAAFNDATALVIFTIILTSFPIQNATLLSATGNFLWIIGGGLLAGFLVAFVAEILTSLVSDRSSETILTISAVYGSYALATALGFSGLIAVAIVGLYFGNLTIRTAMSPATRDAVIVFWEIAAFFGNSVAFLAIGLNTNILLFASSLSLIVIALVAVTAARAVTVYTLIFFNDSVFKKKKKKMIKLKKQCGMRGALSIALVFSISTATMSSSDLGTIRAMVLGVVFISLSLQAALLFRYIDRRFPEEQQAEAEELNVRLSKAVSAIEFLQKMREEGKISEEDYVIELEKDKDELSSVLGEIKSSLRTATILKTRASGLYSSLVTLPMTKAMHVLRINRMNKPIETMISDAAPKPSSDAPADTSEMKKNTNPESSG